MNDYKKREAPAPGIWPWIVFALFLALTPAVRAENTIEIKPPIPAGQWAIALPPAAFDPEIGRLVLVDTAPRDKWSLVETAKNVTSKELCERFRAIGIQTSRNQFLDDPNHKNEMMMRDWELGMCVQSDGSSGFTPQWRVFEDLKLLHEH